MGSAGHAAAAAAATTTTASTSTGNAAAAAAKSLRRIVWHLFRIPSIRQSTRIITFLPSHVRLRRRRRRRSVLPRRRRHRRLQTHRRRLDDWNCFAHRSIGHGTGQLHRTHPLIFNFSFTPPPPPPPPPTHPNLYPLFFC